MTKFSFIQIIFVAFIFSAIALTSDGCITTLPPGDCTLDACGKWCHDTYQGYGRCIPADKSINPKYYCLCNHIIGCPI
ncbi:S locus-related glycoprotein 1-binding pollen coat protein (SLR1-BP) [Medicago truncatula]|uniref:S locus-related glycoprotein 1-binding pollen coat protein (SLR1-BP) n=1 Tax=Medicago truncatula TaxID=3880 RepID=A0A072V799_MEDTR|nr:S locus-related glycoprotein 1-binding pollen coat protein (SLR1-BP) [Medicago truncatula]